MTSCSRTNKSKPKKCPSAGTAGRVSPCYARAAAYHASRRDLGAGKSAPDHNGEILPLQRETSAIRWIPNIFSLAGGEVDAFKSESTENDETETVNTSSSASPPPRESGTKRRTTAWSSSPSHTAWPWASCSSCATLRASFSAFLSEEFNAKTPACSSRSLWPVWRRCRNERGRLQRRKTAAATAACRRARDLRRSVAHTAREGEAVQRRRL